MEPQTTYPISAAQSPPTGWVRRVGFHALGGLLTVVATVVGLYAGAMVFFLTSVCNDGTAVVDSHRRTLRVLLVGVGLVVACVPALWAGIARKAGRAALPWAVVSGVVVLVALVVAATAQPTPWCLF